MRDSTAIKYWNLWISSFTGGKTSEQTLTDIKQQAHLVDFTKTEDQARTERSVAWKCLVKWLHKAEELRESELKQRAEDSAAVGDCQATLSYENLIEHERSRSQWNKIFFF